MDEELYTQEEIMLISENMRSYGGSFVMALGEALSNADYSNQRKLERAFPEYFKEYLEI